MNYLAPHLSTDLAHTHGVLSPSRLRCLLFNQFSAGRKLGVSIRTVIFCLQDRMAPADRETVFPFMFSTFPIANWDIFNFSFPSPNKLSRRTKYIFLRNSCARGTPSEIWIFHANENFSFSINNFTQAEIAQITPNRRHNLATLAASRWDPFTRYFAMNLFPTVRHPVAGHLTISIVGTQISAL